MSPKTTVEKRVHSITELNKSMHERQQETPIHQVDTQLGVPLKPERSPQPKRVKPPLPPPPNPQCLDTATTSDSTTELSEAFTPPVTDPPNLEDPSAVSETPNSNPLYEAQTEGPLTYYNYYFEEMGTIVPDSPDESSPRSKLAVGMVGAGVVAATVVSGLVVGDAWQKSQGPEAGKPKDASLKQDSARNLTRTPSVTPERQQMERSQPKPRAIPAPQPQAKSGKTSFLQPPPQIQTPPLSPPMPITPPDSLVSAPTSASPPMSRPATAPVQTRPSSSWVANNIPQVSVRDAANRQATLSPVAPPETLPIEPSNLPQGTSLPPQETSSNLTSETLPSPPPNWVTGEATMQPEVAEEPQPNIGVEPTNEVEPNLPLPVPSPANAREANGLQQLFPIRQAQVKPSNLPAGPSANASPDQTIAVNPSSSNSSTQRIQEYLDLPKTLPPTRSISLMPLSEQAAVEAASTAQVGQFTVRQVSTQEYQKEWATSTKTDDPLLANAFPAYGFIDYQRRVIVVLQDKSQTESAQSQQLTSSNSVQ